MWNCLEVSELRIGTLTFNTFDFITEKWGRYKSQAIKNKMACFNSAEPQKLANEYIRQKVRHSYIPENSKIFVSSKVRTARDLFRHSRYQITRDPDSAAATIVPVLPNNSTYFWFDVATYDEENKVLTLYSVNRNEELRKSNVPYTESDWTLLQQHFKNRNLTFFQESFFKNGICQFLPNIEEYKDILTLKYPRREYRSEISISINYPMEFNAETLSIWSHYSDYEMLARQICASNWTEYPSTLVAFLMNEWPTVNMKNFGGVNFKMVLETIGYDYYDDIDNVLEDRIIQPKDWNMLQTYLMTKMGLPEQGGFVNQDSYKEAVKIAKYFYKRAAVKPMMIETPMLYQNLTMMADVS